LTGFKGVFSYIFFSKNNKNKNMVGKTTFETVKKTTFETS